MFNALRFAGRLHAPNGDLKPKPGLVPPDVDALVEQAIGRSNEARQVIRSSVRTGTTLGDAIARNYQPPETLETNKA